MNVAYIRVSTAEQNEARQIEAMQKYNIDKWFTEKISGKDTNRPKLQELMEYVREGDVVHIHDFSRLARSTKDLLDIVEMFESKGVTLVSNKETLDTSTATGKLMLTVIGAIAQFELQNTKDRQLEGIAIAKANGKYKGGKRKKVPDFEEKYQEYLMRKIPSKAALAKELKISRPTLDKLIHEHKQKGSTDHDKL